MRDKNLGAALRKLDRVLASPTHSPVQLRNLQVARRELAHQRQAGKLDSRSLFRAVALIAEVLYDERAQTRGDDRNDH